MSYEEECKELADWLNRVHELIAKKYKGLIGRDFGMSEEKQAWAGFKVRLRALKEKYNK